MYFILNIYLARWGYGRHLYYLVQTKESHEKLIEVSKISYLSPIIFLIGQFFVKCSIGVMLLRIFGTKKTWKKLIYSIMVFVSVTKVLLIVTILAQCRPLRKLWAGAAVRGCWSADVNTDLMYFNGGQSSYKVILILMLLILI